MNERGKSNAGLSKAQKQFIDLQKISYSNVFDASGLKRAKYMAAMKDSDYVVAVNVTPCEKYGHQIRSRYGKCVQCNTAALEFQDRKNREGYVYVCYSAINGFAKIGMTGNPDQRFGVLKNQQYASVSDWEMVYKIECRHAGLVEYESQKLIERFRIERTYSKDGRTQSCYEIFECSAAEATGAVKKALTQAGS